MRVILLAAGLGTRLKPLTNTVPKCLVTIKGKVLLGIWLERLIEAGADAVLVNTSYLADLVGNFLNTSPYQERVSTVYEPNLLGTAGTLRANLNFFEMMDGMLIHADNYCLADLVDFQKAHFSRPKVCIMTMMIFRSDNPSSCGIVELNERGIVVGFHEKVPNPPGRLANGAVYMLSAEFYDFLRLECPDANDFSLEILPRLIGRIFTYETSEVFVDIGTMEAYKKVNE